MLRSYLFIIIVFSLLSNPILAQTSINNGFEQDTSTTVNRKYFIGVSGNIGWSSNYGMKYSSYTYERNSPALLWSAGPFFELGSKAGLRLGLNYTSILFWDSEADSSYYSTTGVVTYRDVRYSRSYTSLNVGIQRRFDVKKFQLVAGIYVHRPFFPVHHVKDYIDQTNNQVYLNGKGRGFNFEFSIGLSRQISPRSGLTLGYSLVSINDRTKNSDVGYSSYPDVVYWGTFHSIALSISLRL